MAVCRKFRHNFLAGKRFLEQGTTYLFISPCKPLWDLLKTKNCCWKIWSTYILDGDEDDDKLLTYYKPIDL